VAGHWWRTGQDTGFTVEAGLAKTLNIRLGDRLDFDVGGLPLSGRVSSLRKVEWDTFRVNFFVATHPARWTPCPRATSPASTCRRSAAPCSPDWSPPSPT